MSGLRLYAFAVAVVLLSVSESTAGAISGRVRAAATAAPVVNVVVHVYSVATGMVIWSAGRLTDQTGQYTTPDLPPGTYFVFTRNWSGFIDEAYRDAQCRGPCESVNLAAMATPVAVTTVGTASDIDFELEVGGTISGTITDGSTSGGRYWVPVRLVDEDGAYVQSVYTDQAGFFRFTGLPTGTYYAHTTIDQIEPDMNRGFVNEMYDGVQCDWFCNIGGLPLDRATPILVVAGVVTADRDFTLERGGSLTGTVFNATAGRHAVRPRVTLYRRSTLGMPVLVGSVDDTFTGAGAILFAGLRPETYYFFTSNTEGLVDEIYDDIPCAAACSPQETVTRGTPVVLGSGTTVPFSVSLNRPALSSFSKISPGHGATTSPSPVLSWAVSTGATDYRYCVDTTDNNSCDTAWVSVGGATSATVTGLQDLTTYYWQVEARDAANVAAANSGAWWAFTTDTTLPQPPTGLRVAEMTGNLVTLRWDPAPLGPPATMYVVEGGQNAGEVLAAHATNTSTPVVSLAIPTGAWSIRVHSITDGRRSTASNELRVFVNVPQPPSAPDTLLASVNGSSLDLAWRHTFNGGAPTGTILDVAGAFSLSVPLPAGQSFSFSGVPAGTYTLQVRAANAAGVSAASNRLTLTIPSICWGPPLPPARFLAYRVGSTVRVLWEPAASGPAPTSYVVAVAGSVSGSFMTRSRSVAQLAPPGSYTLTVSAVNQCGEGSPTAAQTVVVP